MTSGPALVIDRVRPVAGAHALVITISRSLWTVVQGSNLLLYGDTDGDATTAEFMIQLVGEANLPTLQPWGGLVL